MERKVARKGGEGESSRRGVGKRSRGEKEMEDEKKEGGWKRREGEGDGSE